MKPYRRRALRTVRDENEPEIITALLAAGLAVEKLDHPVDLLVSNGEWTMVIEVKRPGRHRGTTIGVKATQPGGEFAGLDFRLTEREAKFLQRWPGDWAVVDSVEQALEAVGCDVAPDVV